MSKALIGYKRSEEYKAKISKRMLKNKIWLGRKHSEESKAKLRKANLGNTNCLGRKMSEESKAKLRKANLGKKHSEENKSKMSKSKLGRKMHENTRTAILKANLGRKNSEETKSKMSKSRIGWKYSEETKAKMSKSGRIRMLRDWQNPEYVKKMRAHIFPNKPETYLIGLLNQILPGEYRYTGDIGINGTRIGGKIPDFMNVNGQKKIIEFFGDYYHGELKTGISPEQNEIDKVAHFKDFGFKTLIIWGHELNNESELINKIINFNKGGL